MTAPLTIRIPMTPDRVLSPNSGKHKRTREPYRDAIKDAAASATINALARGTWSHDGPIVLHIIYGWEFGRKRCDFDNSVALAKHPIDAVFDKIAANDRQVTGIYVSQVRDREGKGFMVITVEPVAAEEAAA